MRKKRCKREKEAGVRKFLKIREKKTRKICEKGL